MLIIVIYYIVSILTIWLCFYFKKFTSLDYKSNRSLQRKRRVAIVWTYFVMFLQAGVWAGREILFFYPVHNQIIIGSSCIFMIIYIFLLGWIETIKHPSNKKKKLK